MMVSIESVGRQEGVHGQEYVRLFFLQSAQILLVSSFRRLLMVTWFWAALSAAGLGGRRDMLAGYAGLEGACS